MTNSSQKQNKYTLSGLAVVERGLPPPTEVEKINRIASINRHGHNLRGNRMVALVRLGSPPTTSQGLGTVASSR